MNDFSIAGTQSSPAIRGDWAQGLGISTEKGAKVW